MSSTMVKTSVTVPTEDLAAAHRLGINVSALVRDALRARLRDETLEREIEGYEAAFSEWNEGDWDYVAGDGLAVAGPT